LLEEKKQVSKVRKLAKMPERLEPVTNYPKDSESIN